MRLGTNRWVVQYFHARSPADRPPQRIPIQWTHCTFGGARPWFSAFYAVGVSASSIMPTASLVVGRAARLAISHSAPGESAAFT